MKYRFKPTENFWESFYDLRPSQKDSARQAWQIFKTNPFDPRLRAHKIHRLSAITSGRFTRWTLKATCAPHSLSKVIWLSPWTSARTIFTKANFNDAH